MTMNVTINGEAKHLNGAMTLNEMLAFLGLDPKKIAVERNLEIVPRSTYASVQVKDGDKYEIVHFIGGGKRRPRRSTSRSSSRERHSDRASSSARANTKATKRMRGRLKRAERRSSPSRCAA